MKKYFLFALTFMNFICYSQEELKFVFDKKNNKIESDKTHNKKVERIGLKEGEEYKIILERINNSIHQSIIETKPFMNNSQTPEILKTIFPFTESAQVNQLFKTQDSDPNLTAFNNAKMKYKQLIFLKNMADDLYAKILLSAGKKVNDTSQLHENRYCAKKKFEILEQEFKKTLFDDRSYECCFCFEKEKENFKKPECNQCSIKEEKYTFQELKAYVKTNKQKLELLNMKITSNMFFIKSLEIYLKARVEKAEAPNVELLNELAKTSKFVNDIKNKDFTDYSNFIFKAITSTTSTKPKTFVASNDGTEIKIKLINLYTKDTIKSKAFDFYSRNEWSFDFSSGFFFNNQVEDSYFLKAREGDTTRVNLVKESTRDFDVSFGAMGHLSYKFSSGFKAGISMGASLSPLDAKTRYLLGGSMIFGKKNQLALNIGASFVKLKVLSGSVNEDTEGKFVAPSVTTVPTFERIKRGLYFGVTYNLTSKKKFQE